MSISMEIRGIDKNGQTTILNGYVVRKQDKLEMDGGHEALLPFAKDGEWGFSIKLGKIDLTKFDRIECAITY